MNFQAASRTQGLWFENLCRAILIDCGFTLDGEHVDIPEAGVEVDLIATNRYAISFYNTCKGSYRGARPGVQRTDTLKKALAEAQALHAHGWGPILLLTSHLPNTRSGRELLASVDPEVLFDAIDPLHNARRLRWLAQADEEALRRDLDGRRSLFTVAKDSVPPCVGEISAVLVRSNVSVAHRASPPPLRAHLWAGAAAPWAFTRPKHPDS